MKLLGMLVVALSACGALPVSDAGVESDAGQSVSLPDGGAEALPVTLSELKAFALSGAHRQWVHEAAPHASTGPHSGQVQSFFNPVLAESLKSGQATHPIGSIVVKELSSGGRITGYAVDVKRTDGQWVFFEGFDPAYNQYYFTGTANLCGNCHQAGVDFVLTPRTAVP